MLDGDTLPIGCYRLVLPADGFEVVSHTAECTCSLWIELKHSTVSFDGFVMFAGGTEDAAVQHERLCCLWSKIDDLLCTRDSGIEVLEVTLHVGQIDPGPGVVRREFCRSLQEDGGFAITLV